MGEYDSNNKLRFIVGPVIESKTRHAVYADSQEDAVIAYFQFRPKKEAISVWDKNGKSEEYFFSDIEKLFPTAKKILSMDSEEQRELIQSVTEKFKITQVEESEKQNLLAKRAAIITAISGAVLFIIRSLMDYFSN